MKSCIHEDITSYLDHKKLQHKKHSNVNSLINVLNVIGTKNITNNELHYDFNYELYYDFNNKLHYVPLNVNYSLYDDFNFLFLDSFH